MQSEGLIIAVVEEAVHTYECVCAYVCALETAKEKEIVVETASHTSQLCIYKSVMLCTVLYAVCFICGDTASV